jgi:hypothetical protein
MFDKGHHYFPEFDSAALMEFVGPFCRLMFAYTNCEREIVNVVCAATGNLSDENEFSRGSVKNLGHDVEKFFRKKNGDTPEITNIKEQIHYAAKAYALRNDLAHGHWWRFDSGKNSVSVRRDRNAEDRFVEITVKVIEEAIGTFENAGGRAFQNQTKTWTPDQQHHPATLLRLVACHLESPETIGKSSNINRDVV